MITSFTKFVSHVQIYIPINAHVIILNSTSYYYGTYLTDPRAPTNYWPLGTRHMSPKKKNQI